MGVAVLCLVFIEPGTSQVVLECWNYLALLPQVPNQSLFAKAWIIINHPRNKCFVESLRWRLHRMTSNVYPSLCPVVQDLVHLRQSSLFEGHSVFMMFKCLEIPWTKISQPFFCTASTAFGHTGRFDSHQRCHLCRETSGERAHSSMGFLSKFSSKAILLVL